MERTKPRAWPFLSFVPRQESKSESMKRLAVSLAVALVSLPLWSTTAVAGTYNVYFCGPWSSSTQPFVPAASSHASYSIFGCGGGGERTNERSRRRKRTERSQRQLDDYCPARPKHHSHLHGR